MGVDGLKLTQSISQEAIDALLFEPNDPEFSFKSRELAEIFCLIERENDHSFLVHMKACLKLFSLCGRCLEPLDIPCELDFSIRMLESEHLGEDTECSFDSADLLGEEQTVGYFSDRCIDLGLILRDQIYLQMPDYPQCASDVTDCNKSLARANESSQQTNPFVKLFKK